MPSSPQTLPVVQIFGYVYNPFTQAPVPQGTPVTITWKVALGSIANPLVNVIPESQTVFTDANGYWTANVVPPDKLSPANSTYHVTDTYNSFDIGNFTLAGMPVGGYQDLNIRVAPAPAVLQPGAQTVGALTVTGLLTAQAGLTVTGATTTQSISASGLISGSAGLTISAGGAAITGNSTVTGTLTVSGGLTVQAGGAAITGNSTVTGTLTVTSTSTFQNTLTISAGGAAITGNSTVTGTLTVSSTLTVQGGGASITGGLTVASGGAAITGNSTVTGTLTISSTLILTGVPGQIFMNQAGTAQIVGGTTGFAINNNANSAANATWTDAGLLTLRNALSIPPSAGGTLAATSYGTVPVKIAEATPSGVASVTFSSIPGGFRHLLLEFRIRSANASTDAFMLRFNNDSGANYDYMTNFAATGSTESIAESLGQALMQISYAPSAAATVGYFGSGEAKIVNYADATTANKDVFSHGGWSETNATGLAARLFMAGFGKWRTTATAINRLDLSFGSASNFVAGSVITLWGIP